MLDLPDLPRALALERLTLWEAARLAPASKGCLELYHSRRSPHQARLLQLLSSGVPKSVSGPQLMRLLRDLNAAVRKPWRPAHWPEAPPYILDAQGREAQWGYKGPIVPAALTLRTWPSACSCNSGVHVVGHGARYKVFDTAKGVFLSCHNSRAVPVQCPLCTWQQELIQRGWTLVGARGPRVWPMSYAPCERHGDVIWLKLSKMDGPSFEAVRGLVLAAVQRAMSFPRWGAAQPLPSWPWLVLGAGLLLLRAVSLVPQKTAGQGSEFRIDRPPPPVFVFCNEVEDSPLPWKEADTWEPFRDGCDVLIVERHLVDSAGCRETYNKVVSLLRDQGKSRMRPKILVIA